MTEWLSTKAAASMLGTSITTVRSMATRGELEYVASGGQQRRRWRISRKSVLARLASEGRIDAHQQAQRVELHRDQDLRERLADLMKEYEGVLAERDRLREEVVLLRAVALELRARNEAVTEAEAHQAEVGQHLLAAIQSQARVAEALRRGLSAQDAALGQYLVPGQPL